MTLSNLNDLAERLDAVEDRLAIYTLIASHPPSADTGFAEYTRDVYLPDGVFDRGPNLEGAKGVDEIASFALKPAHGEAIHLGLAHFGALPLIDLRGRHAIVTSYLQILHLDHGGVPRDIPNHGLSQGYRIHRVVVNRWELEKTNGQWMIRRRTILPVDGSPQPLKLLSQGLSDILKERKTRASKAGSR